MGPSLGGYCSHLRLSWRWAATAESAEAFAERRAACEFMGQLIERFLEGGVDGRVYASALGEGFRPFAHVLALSSTVRLEL